MRLCLLTSKKTNNKSRVKQSYNSYGSLSTKGTMVEILQREQRPLTPKEISWISRKDSRFKTLNHSTVKVYCRQLLDDGKVQQPIYGYYEVTKPMYGVGGGVGVRVHDLRLVWCVGRVGVVPDFFDAVGGVSVQVVFGSKRGKVSATVGCDDGMDFHTVCFAVARVKEVALEKVGVNLNLFPCEVCCEFNEDYYDLRLDGVKCATVNSFLGDLERIYNKDNCLRSEVKVEKTSLESVYTMLKGGVTPYNILQSQFVLMKKLDKIASLLEANLNKR